MAGNDEQQSCAAGLAAHPDKFKVTLLERNDTVGGQASSIAIDETKFGAPWVNNGVQGGSGVRLTLLSGMTDKTDLGFKIFKHTFKIFRSLGYPVQPVDLQISFGKGTNSFWTNVFPSSLVEQYAGDIKKFGYFLKVIKWTLPMLGLVPIRIILPMFWFSKDFGDKMVYPLMALFLGTGNQTANVPCGIVERLFNDPNMKLWDYDESTLLPNLPKMYTFDNLLDCYAAWQKDLVGRGVIVRTGTEVCKVVSRSSRGVKLHIKSLAAGGSEDATEESFDEMVLCVLADDSLRVLGNAATWREKFVLGGAAFYDDITVTHSDKEYFERHYETRFDSSLCATPQTESQRRQVSAASDEDSSGTFRPMYFTSSYDRDPRLLEMSFNCSNYQHQLKGPQQTSSQKFDPVYQSIFLDKQKSNLWTMDEIDETKIVKKNWWHQLGHRWQHYLRVVPLMMFLNGKNHTLYAGSWTLVVRYFNRTVIFSVSGG